MESRSEGRQELYLRRERESEMTDVVCEREFH